MKLYGCRFTYYSSNCHDCEFCYSCIGCESCFMCTNLTNKKYCIENIPYSKEEFELKRNSFYQNTNREKSLNLKKLVISHSQLFSKNQSAENIL